jgi:hypothetical protein
MMENVAEVRMKRPQGGGKYASPTTFIVGYRLAVDERAASAPAFSWSAPKTYAAKQTRITSSYEAGV